MPDALKLDKGAGGTQSPIILIVSGDCVIKSSDSNVQIVKKP